MRAVDARNLEELHGGGRIDDDGGIPTRGKKILIHGARFDERRRVVARSERVGWRSTGWQLSGDLGLELWLPALRSEAAALGEV